MSDNQGTQSTWEEASRCPKCGVPGKEGRNFRPQGLPRGAKVVEVLCTNERCEWFGTPWMVQVNADGSVPPKTDHSGKPKQYVGFEGHDEMAERLIRAVKLEDELSKQPGGHNEVHSPFRRRDI